MLRRTIESAAIRRDTGELLVEIASRINQRGGTVVVDFSSHDVRPQIESAKCVAVDSADSTERSRAAHFSCIVNSLQDVRSLVDRAVSAGEYIRIRGFRAEPDPASLGGWAPDDLWRAEVTESEILADWIVAKAINDYTAVAIAVAAEVEALLSGLPVEA